MQQKLYTLCALSAVLLVACLMFGSAGCIQSPVNTENRTLEAPEDMVLVLVQYADVVVSGFHKVDTDFQNLADEVGMVAGNSTAIIDLLLQYYAENPSFSLLEYYPADDPEGMFVPETSSRLSSAVAHHHNESDFTGSHILRTGPFYVSEYGYVTEGSLPVYAPDGTYCGYICLFFDSGMMFHEFAGEVPELSEYAVSALLPDGWVLYSTATEYIGWEVSGGSLDFVAKYPVDYNALVVLPGFAPKV